MSDSSQCTEYRLREQQEDRCCHHGSPCRCNARQPIDAGREPDEPQGSREQADTQCDWINASHRR
jgi:hypothetical protein